jgi:phosphopantothenoylcysteine synthetase/decarboxylase
VSEALRFAKRHAAYNGVDANSDPGAAMNILVTAGNTQVLIDKVRCLTNIFTGRTGTRIALDAHARGHSVTLLTSHPEVVEQLHGRPAPADRLTVRPYRTFDDLLALMKEAFASGPRLDAAVHSAAVSDFVAGGAFTPAAGTRFDAQAHTWHAEGTPALQLRRDGKIKSDEPELWLRLTRAPKLIDMVRSDWGFRGVLVKFKLEVGVTEERLLEIAERSRRHSDADLMAANTLEGAAEWAYLGPLAGRYERLPRADLSGRLLAEVERLHAAKG